jgi:hypothetical protein
MQVTQRVMLALAVSSALMASTAHADLLGSLKSAATEQLNQSSSGSGSNSLASLGALLNGSDTTLKAKSATNAAGILQYCVKNNVLSAGNADAVKDKLLTKLGITSPSGAESQDYQDGLGGILHTGQGKNLDLNNLGTATDQLKEKITTKACDVVLKQSTSLL